MKLDKLPTNLFNLPKNQRFFLACWYNLTSEDSLDSDRISVVNAITGLTELNDLYLLGQDFNADVKRVTVGLEVCSMLQKDTLLGKPHYKNIKDQLIKLLSKEAKENGVNHVNSRQTLVASLAKELVQLANKNYIADALEEVEALLDGNLTFKDDDEERRHFEKIIHATHQLIAALIVEGAHLAELSWISRNVLAKSSNENFQERFTKLRKILLQEPERYRVTIKLSDQRFNQKVIEYGGQIVLGDFIVKANHSGNCEATTDVEAKSFYKAGNIAHERLNDVVDLLNHPMGRSAIVISSEYEVETLNSAAGKKVKLEHERLVPNPTYIFSSEKFKKYVDSIVAFSHISSSKKIPLMDAFRLSRIGTNSKNLESKFLTYWTALETLTHNSFPSETSQDLRIASALTPCITIDYINKRLASFLSAFAELKISKITDKNGKSTDLTSITNLTFFKEMQNQDFCDAVYEAIEKRTYFQYQFKRFAYFCVYPDKLKENLENHQSKVRWQIQRIYRARNAIVHSGRKVSHLELLCANLEHYLKISLSSLTDLLSSSPSIESAEECFVRYDHAVSDILKNLKHKGSNFDSLYEYLTVHQ